MLKIISDIIIFISTEVIKMNLADFCCGMLAGWSYTLVGQPLDYLKTVMQTTTKNLSEINIMKDIYKKHGFKGFYRGSSSMFLGFSLVGGMQFCVYEWVKRQIYYRTGNRKGQYDPMSLSLWEVGLSGAICGSAATFIYCPTEYAKIQRQLSKKMNQSSLQLLFRQLYSNGFKNVFKGYWITTLRQTYGSFVYFGMFQYMVRTLTKQKRHEVENWVTFFAGSIGGLFFTLMTYPIDSVKSNIQAGMKFGDAVKNGLEWSKMKGYRVVLPRSMMASACNFWVYETAQKYVYFYNNFYLVY